MEIKSGDRFDKNISSLNKRLSYKGKKDWLISYWNYRKTLFSLKEEATKRSFSSSSMHTKDRDIVSISPIFLIKRILFDLSVARKEKKRGEGEEKNVIKRILWKVYIPLWLKTLALRNQYTEGLQSFSLEVTSHRH